MRELGFAPLHYSHDSVGSFTIVRGSKRLITCLQTVFCRAGNYAGSLSSVPSEFHPND